MVFYPCPESIAKNANLMCNGDKNWKPSKITIQEINSFKGPLIMDNEKLEIAIQDCWNDMKDNSFDINNPKVRLHEPTFNAEEIIAFTKQMLTTKVTMGDKVKEFENKYCEKYSYKHGVSNNSGSSANLLMLSVLTSKLTEDHLKRGDEIILPALTWSTTVWPVIQMGLVPVYIDCDLDSFNIDTDKIEQAITSKTKAIFSVPIYGNPCKIWKIFYQFVKNIISCLSRIVANPWVQNIKINMLEVLEESQVLVFIFLIILQL